MKSLLRNRNYMKLFMAGTISRFGDSIDMIAYGFMVYYLTGSKVLLATVYIFNVLPNILFSSFAGTFVDYFPKKRIVITGDFLRTAVVACTALMYAGDLLQPWHLMALTFANSTIECFASPAKTSVIPKMVDEKDLHKVNSSMKSITQLFELLGLALAGTIIGFAGLAVAVAVDAATFLISGLLICFVDFPEETRQPLTKENYMSAYAEGFRFVFSEKVFLVLLINVALLNFFTTPINALGVAYVDEVIQMGPEGLGYLSIAQVIGMVLGGFLAGKIGSSLRISTLTLMGLLFGGIAYTTLSLPAWFTMPSTFIMGATSMFFLGIFLPFANSGLQTFIMTHCPEQMLARYLSLLNMMGMSANPLGAFMAGLIVSVLPLHLLLLTFGILFTLSSLLPYKAMNGYLNHKDKQVLEPAA